MGHGARWAFTSDGCQFLLIDTSRGGRPQERIVDRHHSAEFTLREQLDSPAFLEAQVHSGWVDLIDLIAPIVVGLAEPEGMAPDEIFIESLRALLAGPVAAIRLGLDARRLADTEFADRLVVWMVDTNGWIHDPSKWPDEVQRIAQLAAYVFTTRLLFYEALRRAQPALPKLTIAEGTPARPAIESLKAWFAMAREETGDYQTLFNWDEAGDFALVTTEAVAGWVRVLHHLATFDLSEIGFDIVGKIFERLIEPNERYRWGQHYTQPDVVDLMLSFANPNGEGAILDPAAGGGTFLVRAYERKAKLVPSQSHQDRLTELFGIDISSFAATLATINLAARHLMFEENFPQVISKSFFQVTPDKAFMQLPSTGVELGTARRDVVITPISSVVCNPPYVRRTELGSTRLLEAEASLVQIGPNGITPPRQVKGAANYHLFFWFHAATFLAPGGRLAFITSGEWLDSDYGVTLQKWLLANFHIEVVIESLAEPWFTEARVGTVVLVARHCVDSGGRSAGLVRFITLRQTLRSMYGGAIEESDRIEKVDALRDRILAIPPGIGESEDLDWSVVRQSELLDIGTEGVIDEAQDGRYVGAAWRSRYLRAPKVALTLANRPDFCPLGELAEVRLGLKTGSDKFFFLNVTDSRPAESLFSTRAKKIGIKGLGNWEGAIDSRDLKSAVLNPHRLERDDGARSFLIPRSTSTVYLFPRDQTPSGDLGAYVAFAEMQGTDDLPLVKSNGTANRWYRQVRSSVTSQWVMPYNSQYDFGAWENPYGAVLNGRFIGVDAKEGVDAQLLGAVLNSTFVATGRLMQGVPTGTEGAIDVGPPAARLMAVPDVRQMNPSGIQEIQSVLERLRNLDVMPPAPDADGSVVPIRRELDIAILVALGMTRGQASALAGRCYESYARWRQRIRQVEEQMARNRRAMNKAGVNRSGDPLKRLAKRIWEELAPETPLLPSDQLHIADKFETVEIDRSWRPGPDVPMLQPGRAIGRTGEEVDLGSWHRVQYAGMLLNLGVRGPLPIPLEEQRAQIVVTRFSDESRRLLHAAEARAVAYSGADAQSVVDQVISLWHRACIDAGLTPDDSDQVSAAVD